jgi:hypothetical protein
VGPSQNVWDPPRFGQGGDSRVSESGRRDSPNWRKAQDLKDDLMSTMLMLSFGAGKIRDGIRRL